MTQLCLGQWAHVLVLNDCVRGKLIQQRSSFPFIISMMTNIIPTRRELQHLFIQVFIQVTGNAGPRVQTFFYSTNKFIK